MTITTEMKQAVERAGIEPVRVEDPGNGMLTFSSERTSTGKCGSLSHSKAPNASWTSIKNRDMRILDRLPLYDKPTIISVGRGEVTQVKRNQIVVWVSINETLRPFPAILDTGYSHNLGIARRHLDRWSGADLRQTGETAVGGEIVPQFKALLRVHRNRPGKRWLNGDTHPLMMDQGISVMPDDSPAATRLPVLGLRALIRNDLTLIINGKGRHVTLKTAGWF